MRVNSVTRFLLKTGFVDEFRSRLWYWLDTESADGCEFPSTAHLVGSAEFFDDLLRVERPDEPRDADGRQLIRFQAVPFQKRIEKKHPSAVTSSVATRQGSSNGKTTLSRKPVEFDGTKKNVP